MNKVVCVFTCYNRKDMTKRAIEQLKNNKVNIDFVIVDDNSIDGTAEMLNNMKNVNKTVLTGTGNLFYGGGMRKGMQYLLDNKLQYDYLLIINDDVNFYDNVVDKMIEFSNNKNDSVVVGATHNKNGSISYGGVKYKSKYSTKIRQVGPNESNLECDTFNGNCVLIPYNAFLACGAFDNKYIHNFSEFDYGFSLRRNGNKIFVFNEYVGLCENNSIKNTWEDVSLTRRERIRKKNSPKSIPTNIVFHYFYKNFNLYLAIRCSISPYIRILLRK